jgi:opacity protein-like surface antigen
MKIQANKIVLSLLLINLLTFSAKAEDVVNANNATPNSESTKISAEEQQNEEAFIKEREEQIAKKREKLRKHLFNFYFGPSTNLMEIDYDFKADGYSEEKSNTASFEVAYQYAVTDKLRVGASVFGNGNSLKYNREDFLFAGILVIPQDFGPDKEIEVDAYQQEETEIKNSASINFQTEYDFYKINNFSFFGFAEIGISLYDSSRTYKARAEDKYGNSYPDVTDNTNTIPESTTYSTTGLNYGGGLGANYAITNNVKLTNKVRYNIKQSVDVLEDIQLDLKPEFSYMLGLTVSLDAFYFPRRYR